MNVMQPPSPPRSAHSALRSWITAEWDHIIALPIPTILQLGGLTLVLILFDPLLPFVGYALWLWAAHSWQWKSRWSSIHMLSRQGNWFFAWLCVLAVLVHANIWFFPALASLVQTLWHALYLPGDLGLLPFKNDLFARCVLLLTLAPTAARLYEHLDTRTRTDPPRRLLPEDLAPPTVPPPAAPQRPPTPPNWMKSRPGPSSGAEEEKKDQATTASTTTQEPKPATEKKKRQTRPQPASSSPQAAEEPKAEQLTIDSFLAMSPDQVKQQPGTGSTRSTTTGSSRSTGASRKKKQATTPTTNGTPVAEEPPVTEEPKQPEAINWDDIAE